MTRLRALLAALALTLALGATACSGSGDPSYPPCPDTALTCPQGGGQSSWASPVPLASPTSRGPGSPAAQGMGGSAGPGTSASPSRSATATTAVQAAGFPDARTTGPRIPLTPHNTGAMSVKTSGTVIRGWDITGSLDIYANNVTIVDTKITSTNWWGINLRPGYSGLRVIHSTITAIPGKGPDNGGEDYAVSNSGDSSIEVGWSDISVFGNALSMGQGNIHDNYVHDLVAFRNAAWRVAARRRGDQRRRQHGQADHPPQHPPQPGRRGPGCLRQHRPVLRHRHRHQHRHRRQPAGRMARTPSTGAATAPPASRSPTTCSRRSSTARAASTEPSPPGTRAARATSGPTTAWPTAPRSPPNRLY